MFYDKRCSTASSLTERCNFLLRTLWNKRSVTKQFNLLNWTSEKSFWDKRHNHFLSIHTAFPLFKERLDIKHAAPFESIAFSNNNLKWIFTLKHFVAHQSQYTVFYMFYTTDRAICCSCWKRTGTVLKGNAICIRLLTFLIVFVLWKLAKAFMTHPIG